MSQAAAEQAPPFKYLHAGENRVRMLAKNATAEQLRRHAPAILAYDLASVAGVAVRDRTLAPLLGRWRGLREWRAFRRAGEPRRPVSLAAPRGVRGGLARRAVWARYAAGTGGDPPG